MMLLYVFCASLASGVLLLNRFLYPFRFPFLPNWKSAYIASALTFEGVFFWLLLS
ncbi:hypothetical protein GGQ72_001682 [Rhizobium rhizoryzae]|uniref:Uncharacterized protein n=1 Tax=Rhizobium rhizoryzae TaxID=451876 RepID=A0A7W6LH34_9HYPH|nr:hypothetical protein [Rhizobium rhizoryzae]